MARRLPFLLLLLCLLGGALSSRSVRAAGTSPFPRTEVLGWTAEGTLATLTLTELGRGEVLLHRTPPLRIPLKTAGLCGAAPRWACHLALDPAHPEQPAAGWLARVVAELKLERPLAGPPPQLAGARPRYPTPGGSWLLELSDDSFGTLPLVELVLPRATPPLRYLVWQATFPLDPDLPLTVLWHPRRPLAALLARSAERPHARQELAAVLDLSRPVAQEDRAFAQLAAALARRPVASVKLAALVEEVRSRSQRRVELGAILRDGLGEAGCGPGLAPVVLDAVSFDWSALERGGLLSWGCPVAGQDLAGDLALAYSLFRRERGRWQPLRTFRSQPGDELELRAIDLTQDLYPEIWVREQRAAGPASCSVLGARGGRVEELLVVPFTPACTALPGTDLRRRETMTVGDPDSRGLPALILGRSFFEATGAADSSAPAGPCAAQGGVRQQEEVYWRWNSRLARFYRRARVVLPAGARPLVVDGPGSGAGRDAGTLRTEGGIEVDVGQTDASPGAAIAGPAASPAPAAPEHTGPVLQRESPRSVNSSTPAAGTGLPDEQFR